MASNWTISQNTERIGNTDRLTNKTHYRQMVVSEMGRSFYIQTKETEDQTMATKKTAVIPEEEILAAATEENINEH